MKKVFGYLLMALLSVVGFFQRVICGVAREMRAAVSFVVALVLMLGVWIGGLHRRPLTAAMALLCLCLASQALAVLPIIDQSTNNLGSITWTNNTAYSILKLKTLCFDNVSPSTWTATMKRVTKEGFTNNLIGAGTLVGSAANADIADTNSTVFRIGDMLLITGMGTNSAGRVKKEFDIYP